MVLEYNCWKPLSASNGFRQQNGFDIPVRWRWRWWWWTTMLMMRLKIMETITTTKWVWSTTHRNHFHSKMVLAFRYGDNDGDDDERQCWWWDWRFWKPFPQQNEFGVQLTETISTAKWFWYSGTVMMTVMMINDGVDNEIEDSSGDDDERR